MSPSLSLLYWVSSSSSESFPVLPLNILMLGLYMQFLVAYAFWTHCSFLNTIGNRPAGRIWGRLEYLRGNIERNHHWLPILNTFLWYACHGVRLQKRSGKVGQYGIIPYIQHLWSDILLMFINSTGGGQNPFQQTVNHST